MRSCSSGRRLRGCGWSDLDELAVGEEVVGSNPATPTVQRCTSGPSSGKALRRFRAGLDLRAQVRISP